MSSKVECLFGFHNWVWLNASTNYYKLSVCYNCKQYAKIESNLKILGVYKIEYHTMGVLHVIGAKFNRYEYTPCVHPEILKRLLDREVKNDK